MKKRIPFTKGQKDVLFETFGWSCALCGSIHLVSIHHIVTGNNSTLNGIPLCMGQFNCHKNIHEPKVAKRLVNMTYRKINKKYLKEKDYDFLTTINGSARRDSKECQST